MKRICALASILAVCVASISCNKENGNNNGLDLPSVAHADNFFGEGIAEDGSYMAGTYMFENPAIWDITNDQLIVGQMGGMLHAANKMGIAAGASDGYAILFDKDKKVTNLYTNTTVVKNSYIDPFTGETVENESPVETGSEAYAISADGKIAAGFFFDSSWNTSACIWKAPFTSESDREVLTVPSPNDIAWMVNGAEARWISSDGNTILGWLIDDMGTQPAVIWKKEGSRYVPNPICKGYFDPNGENGLKMMFAPNALSADGNWVGLTVQDAYDPFDWSVEPPAYYGARLNLTTGALEIMDTPSGVCASISNDGTVAGYYEKEMGGNREPFVWRAGQKSAETISTVAPALKVSDYISFALDGIAPDNSFIAGVATDAEYNNITIFVKL